jgi:hypothetical protein
MSFHPSGYGTYQTFNGGSQTGYVYTDGYGNRYVNNVPVAGRL